MLSNLSTQTRPTQTRNTGFLTLPAPRVDRTRADDSEQISPPPITHHTRKHCTKRHETFSETMSLSMRNILVPGGSANSPCGQPPFEPSLLKCVLPWIIAANGPNGSISLTQTFNRILFYVCNGRYFGVQKAKNGDRGTIVFTAALSA